MTHAENGVAPPAELQARGDRELAKLLEAAPQIARLIERQKDSKPPVVGARRQLLATALRLTPTMAPDVVALIEGCRTALDVTSPMETYVYPAAEFNAAAVRPERGRLLMLLSSALLEGFRPDELRFVVGHELAHHKYEHHRLPVGELMQKTKGRLPRTLLLRIFAWKRYAEISCDRAGLYCAGSLEPAARGLFKLASGLSSDRIQVNIGEFLAQVTDLRAETDLATAAEAAGRRDWLSTHPFSPLRLRAAQLFANSSIMGADGMPVDVLEARVDELMTVMDPSYLTEQSDIAESMRRLLVAAGLALATETGTADQKAVEALADLLDDPTVAEVDIEAVVSDLPRRVKRVRTLVPMTRRAQVLRDLCVVARADGVVSEDEERLLLQIAEELEVSAELVSCAFQDPLS